MERASAVGRSGADVVVMLSRGEVWWAQLPVPDGKVRPVVILHRDSVVNRLNAVLAACCTTTARGLPTEVSLDTVDGMPAACVVSIDNTILVRRDQLRRRITKLSAAKMAAVCDALELATGCDRRART